MEHTHSFYAKYWGLSIHIYEKYGKTSNSSARVIRKTALRAYCGRRRFTH